jgi:hypothetical protein
MEIPDASGARIVQVLGDEAIVGEMAKIDREGVGTATDPVGSGIGHETMRDGQSDNDGILDSSNQLSHDGGEEKRDGLDGLLQDNEDGCIDLNLTTESVVSPEAQGSGSEPVGENKTSATDMEATNRNDVNVQSESGGSGSVRETGTIVPSDNAVTLELDNTASTNAGSNIGEEKQDSYPVGTGSDGVDKVPDYAGSVEDDLSTESLFILPRRSGRILPTFRQSQSIVESNTTSGRRRVHLSYADSARKSKRLRKGTYSISSLNYVSPSMLQRLSV